jgi:hypothetical protein
MDEIAEALYGKPRGVVKPCEARLVEISRSESRGRCSLNARGNATASGRLSMRLFRPSTLLSVLRRLRSLAPRSFATLSAAAYIALALIGY